jgi:hypothetical protein
MRGEDLPVLEGLLGITSQQMDILVRTAGPLSPRERARFLVDVAQALRGRKKIDDVAVARVCKDVRGRLYE